MQPSEYTVTYDITDLCVALIGEAKMALPEVAVHAKTDRSGFNHAVEQMFGLLCKMSLGFPDVISTQNRSDEAYWKVRFVSEVELTTVGELYAGMVDLNSFISTFCEQDRKFWLRFEDNNDDPELLVAICMWLETSIKVRGYHAQFTIDRRTTVPCIKIMVGPDVLRSSHE